MKKKISLLLCVLVMALSFVGCSGNASVTDTEKEMLTLYTESIMIGFPSIGSEGFEYYRTMSEFALDYEIQVNTGLPVTGENFVSMINSWEAAEKECGKYVEHGEYEFERTNDGFIVSTDAKYEDRDATISLSYDEDYNMKSLDVSAKFGMGEILTKAGLNTLLGMGTVFAVLIFLAFLISLMKYIPVVMDMFKKKEKNTEVKTEIEGVETVVDTVEVEDDLELIAVITAAIAAQESTTTDGFVVRSIRRRPLNNW